MSASDESIPWFPWVLGTLGAATAGLIGAQAYAVHKLHTGLANANTGGLPKGPTKPLQTVAFRTSDPPGDEDLARVMLDGEPWLVARTYVGPVGIGEALNLAKSLGFELPTPALVDAIWNAADLKVDPPVRASDGTPKTMSTDAVYANQAERIEALIAGRPFTLLAGTHKDVVMLPSGKPGLYGWNVADGPAFTQRTGVPTKGVRGALGVPVTAGRVVQQEFGGHGLDWKDYSQGVRLVKRAPVLSV